MAHNHTRVSCKDNYCYTHGFMWIRRVQGRVVEEKKTIICVFIVSEVSNIRTHICAPYSRVYADQNKTRPSASKWRWSRNKKKYVLSYLFFFHLKSSRTVSEKYIASIITSTRTVWCYNIYIYLHRTHT